MNISCKNNLFSKPQKINVMVSNLYSLEMIEDWRVTQIQLEI